MTLLLLLSWACMHPSDPAPPAPHPTPSSQPAGPARLDATELRDRIASGDLTSRAAVDAALARIAVTNRAGPELRALIATSPTAQAEAAARDGEAGGGPLHGVPVLLKDNIDAAGMPTTAGSLALASHRPGDAFLTARLREAGAVILGKANLSEWANFRSTQSTSGWSGVGGQCRNPHVLDRSPCGSSSGSAVAVAAGLAPLAVGTETDGSILCPASVVGIVGVKPTVGLVSRDGIVPISPSQDTAGPMARTVADAAMLLEVLAVVDPEDRATQARPAELATDYVAALAGATLEGARIGVVPPGDGFDARVVEHFDAAVALLRAQGAEVVPVERPDPAVSAAAEEQEWEVLLQEFRPALEAYLQGVQGVDSLEDLIAFDLAHADTELRWFGHDIFELAAARTDEHAAAYPEQRRASQAAIAGYLDAQLAAHELEALVRITTGPAWPIDPVLGDRYTGGESYLTAIPGWPAVTVPMGAVEGLPVGISFLGRPWTERRLLQLAHAYEQATHHRAWPRFRRTVTER